MTMEGTVDGSEVTFTQFYSGTPLNECTCVVDLDDAGRRIILRDGKWHKSQRETQGGEFVMRYISRLEPA